jgi:hypothetical protein
MHDCVHLHRPVVWNKFYTSPSHGMLTEGLGPSNSVREQLCNENGSLANDSLELPGPGKWACGDDDTRTVNSGIYAARE